MRISITGGTGFIGSRLALKHLEVGHSVHVFGQINSQAEETNRKDIESAGAEIMLGSMTDPLKLDEITKNIHTVYHLAAAQHEANIPDRLFWQVNVEGTRNLLEACAINNVQRLVYGSTIGVYGSPEGIIDEDTLVNPDNIYGVTKLEAEKTVLSSSVKLPVVVVRIPETYGPGDRRLLKLFKAINSGVFFMIGSGENRHHVIFIDDLIDGLIAAATSDKAVGDVFLLAGNDAPTTNEMVSTIARELGRRPPKFHAPLFPFTLTAVLLESVLRPLGIQPPLHKRRMDFFKKSFVIRGDKSASTFGFHAATSFKQGVCATAAWYGNQGLL